MIDCYNSDIFGFDVLHLNHRPGFHFTTPNPSLAERLAADVQQARVAKAFSTLPAQVIELDRTQLASHRVAVFLCADDPPAKSVVKGLAEDLGFIGVDSGELEPPGLSKLSPTSPVFRSSTEDMSPFDQ